MGLGRVVVSAALVAALALMAGCGVRPSVDPAATSEELAATFADCRWGDGVDRGEPVAEFEHVAEWLRVASVVAADRDADGYAPAQVRDDAGTTRDVEVHHHEWPAVDWALENDAEVWFVIRDPGESGTTVPMVGLTMIVTPAGSVFFPGGCFDRWLRQQVGEPLGDRVDEALAALPYVEAADVRAHLGVLMPEPPKSDEVGLSEGYVKRHGLTTLKRIGFEATISDVVGDAEVAPVICARIGAGWGECFVPDGSILRGGAGAIAWVDEDGVLEFWLLDENVELSLDHPLGKLGEVQTGRRSVHVHIDTSGIAADGSFEGHDRVTVVE